MRAKKYALTELEKLWTKRIIEEGVVKIENIGYRNQFDEEIEIPNELELSLLNMKLLSMLKVYDLEDPAWS